MQMHAPTTRSCPLHCLTHSKQVAQQAPAHSALLRQLLHGKAPFATASTSTSTTRRPPRTTRCVHAISALPILRQLPTCTGGAAGEHRAVHACVVSRTLPRLLLPRLGRTQSARGPPQQRTAHRPALTP